ncbi:hypothetical protein DA075_09650 [Methylobacterium currus]|uniref:Uncharacterized protein n=1 Tax=Methylobacterium currus TaxID=2051553 RepID=A0A2R4WHX2_9HYPH|nr:hypothetical protein [Methylobacterium currus]AWB21138.1 hypothetical protein DA075_09650 [Methylobacterium currus]UHC14023.1 hypothetical protein LRS73_15685 [Methylobacterium currus]
MPHLHAPAVRADAAPRSQAAPRPQAAPRSQAAPFSLLRVGVGPRIAVAALLAAALWALIGWAMA